MDNSKKEGENLAIKIEIPNLGFLDSEKVVGIPNDFFPLVIMVTMANCDDNRSYGIMYAEILENLGLKKDNLWPYNGSKLKILYST